MHPVLFKSSAFTIYSYGVCVALAVTLAWVMTLWLARRAGYPAAQAADLLFVMFVSGIAGARLFYAFQHPGEYEGHWHEVFFLQKGGLVWYGGFLGALVCGVAAARRTRIPVLAWADFFAPAVAAAHAVGRVGCFLNGCCFGRAGHPVQLYESASLGALSLFLLARYLHRKKDGEIFGLYLVGYGSLRFALEFLRADQYTHLGLTLPQWISLAVFAAGLVFLSVTRPHVRPDRTDR